MEHFFHSVIDGIIRVVGGHPWTATLVVLVLAALRVWRIFERWQRSDRIKL